jgi:hypothetical protein
VNPEHAKNLLSKMLLEPPDIAPTDIGRRQEEQELNAAIAATSTAEAAAHQSEGGAGEGRGKRVKKTPKHFGTN